MKSFLFKLRYSYRNISRNFFRSFSLFLIITIITFVFMVAFTIKNGIHKGYEATEANNYQNIDIIVTYDTDTKNKIVNSDVLLPYYNQYNWLAGFFKIDSVAYLNDSSEEVEIIAGTSEELGHILSMEFDHLQNDEVILTKTLSEKLNVKLNETIDIYIASNPKTYKVVKIIDDQGIFKDNRVFIQKNAFLKLYSKSVLGYDFSTSTNITICNEIYLNIKNETDLKTFTQTVQELYPHSIVRSTNDYSMYSTDIDSFLAMIYAAIIIVCCALVFVLASIITLRTKNFKNEIGIIETIGGDKKYPFIVFALEVAIFIILSTIFNIVLITYLYQKQFDVFVNNGRFTYHISFIHIIYTVLSVLLISFLLIVWRYNKYKKIETIDLTKNKRFEQNIPVKEIIIVTICILSGLLINCLLLKNWLSYKYYSTLNFILIIVLVVYIVSFILDMISKLFKKNSVFEMSFGRNIRSNHLKHNSLKILLICLAALTAVGAADETIHDTFDQISNAFQIDYVLGNVRKLQRRND